MRIKEYRIAHDELLGLARTIETMIDRGWQPFGSLAISGNIAAQAMVKYSAEKDDGIDIDAAQRLLTDKKAEEAIEMLIELGYNADEVHSAMVLLDGLIDPT